MKRFLKDSRGNVLILAALVFPAALGFGALAIDVAYFYGCKGQLQTAADAAAQAAALQMGNQTTATAVAVDLAGRNVPKAFGTVVSANDIVFGTYDSVQKQFTASSLNVNAVQVVASRRAQTGNAVPTLLGNIFGVRSADISAKAVAVSLGSSACMIALDPNAKQSFSVNGGGTVSVPNCGIYVNSSDATALYQSGSGSVKGKSISVVGGYASGGRYSPIPKPKSPAIADPLAALAEPTMPGYCTYTNKRFTSPQSFPAGTVFCGSTTFNSDVTFQSGIQYFKGATVSTAANISISGNAVMLYFDDTSTWDSTGTGYVSLTAPQSGYYAGIALFGTRTGKISRFKLSGGKDYFVNGTIYLPTQRLELYGSTDLTVSAKNGYVVAQQFYYSGNSTFNFDAFGGTVPTAFSAQRTSLVQ